MDATGETQYMDGDITDTPSPLQDCCGFKHFYSGVRYDHHPIRVPVLTMHGTTRVSTMVQWFEGESDPALNSNAHQLASDIARRFLPGEFNTHATQQRIVDQILDYLAKLEREGLKKVGGGGGVVLSCRGHGTEGNNLCLAGTDAGLPPAGRRRGRHPRPGQCASRCSVTTAVCRGQDSHGQGAGGSHSARRRIAAGCRPNSHCAGHTQQGASHGAQDIPDWNSGFPGQDSGGCRVSGWRLGYCCCSSCCC